MKLNLASGTNIREGWINLDVVPEWPLINKKCDIIWDARTDPIPFPDNSADEIYAGYLLLHLAPIYHIPVIQEMRRVLSPTGVLMVGEVDMDVVLRRFIEDPTNARLCELIWGEQGNWFDAPENPDLIQFDKHCHGFTEASLISFLETHGFVNLNRIKIHSDEVFYELTMTCSKSV
jgi:SAM-dependent methyltransferase